MVRAQHVNHAQIHALFSSTLHAPDVTSTLDKLPIELVDAIVELLPVKSLKYLVLVLTLFCHPCQCCLFRNVTIRRPLPHIPVPSPSLSDFPTSPRLLANISSLTVAFARAHGWPDEPAFSTVLSAIAAHGNVRRLAVMGTGPWAWLAPNTRAALLAVMNNVQLETLKMHDVLAFPAAEMYHLLSRGAEKTLVLSGCTYSLREATGAADGSERDMAGVQNLVLHSNLDEAYAMLASAEAPSLQNVTKLSLREADVDLRHNTLFNSTSIADGLVDLTLICYTLDAPGVVLPATPRLQRLEVQTHMSWILPYGVAPTLAALPSSLQCCVFVFTLAISNLHRFYPSAEQYALFAADDSRGPPSAVAVELIARVVNGHAGVKLDAVDEEMVWEEFQDVVRKGFVGSEVPLMRRAIAELDGFEDD